MSNVVDVSGATLLNQYLANNTAAYLAAHLEPLKVAATSDTKRFVHTEANGTMHILPELPVELPYTNASLFGVTEVKGALDAIVAGGIGGITGTDGFLPMIDIGGVGTVDSPLDYNITNLGYVTSAKPLKILLDSGTGNYLTIKNYAGYHNGSTIDASNTAGNSTLLLTLDGKNRYMADYGNNHFWWINTSDLAMSLSAGYANCVPFALGINTSEKYAYLDIVKKSDDYTGWSQLFRLSGLAHGLTDLFPTTDTALGIYIQNLAPGSNAGQATILRATGSGGALGTPQRAFSIQSIMTSEYGTGLTIDISTKDGTTQKAIAATTRAIDITNNGTVKAHFRGNGALAIGVDTPNGLLHVASSVVGPVTKVLTNNSATGLFSVNVETLQGMGGQMFYTIKAYNATDIQKHSGVVSFSGVRKGSTYTANISEAAQLEAAALSTGTLTDTWSITGTGGVITVSLNANSNLSSLTQISITFTLVQHNANTINLL